MKVLVLTSSYPRYAGDYFGLFIQDLNRGLTAHGIELTVVAPHAANCPRAQADERVQVRRFVYGYPHQLERLSYGAGLLSNVRRQPYLLPLLPLYLFAMRRMASALLRQEKFDVLHAHWWIPAGWIAAQLHHEFGVPYILTSHGSDIFVLLRSRYLRRFAEPIFRSASAVTVNSTAVRDELVRHLPGLTVQIIPAPIDMERLARAARAQASKDKSIPRILFVGRLTRQKGVQFLLEAFPQVLQCCPHAQLIIVGEGPEKHRLTEMARQLNLTERVLLRGSLTNDQALLEITNADVVVLPSVADQNGTEGMGVVLLEALACGKPVVATHTGGITDVVKHQVTGLLVEPRNAPALARAICELLGDRALAHHLAQAGQSYVRDHFSTPVVAQRMQAVYAQVSQEARGTR